MTLRLNMVPRGEGAMLMNLSSLRELYFDTCYSYLLALTAAEMQCLLLEPDSKTLLFEMMPVTVFS